MVIAGVSGAGKSTLARRLSRILQLPYTELDSLFHGPDWTERETFVADVDALTQTERWVSEWQYTAVRPLLLERADTLVWLDLPYRIVLRRVVGRTVRRRLRRERLWNDNVEGPLTGFFTDPDHIVRWSIRSRNKLRDLPELVAAEYPRLQAVRLRSPREVEQFIFAAGTHRADSRDV
ncbi:adenylate kinase [Frondihabitans sucicola]|uniref:Adenylate kinase n=1 Tax=Frondihabitans sucicola TaxID=1268041 RepID=A0ABM8GQ14_9MICO|nr:adenylate kinase [Frondihabitans sucicola]